MNRIGFQLMNCQIDKVKSKEITNVSGNRSYELLKVSIVDCDTHFVATDKRVISQLHIFFEQGQSVDMKISRTANLIDDVRPSSSVYSPRINF